MTDTTMATRPSARPSARFSILRFLLVVALQVAILVTVTHFVASGIWGRQLSAGVLAFAVCFVAFHLFLSYFEWFFHRYVLHSVTWACFKKFADEHRLHHSLTAIRLRPTATGSHRVILNEYPITREPQFESMAFPFYSLTVFWLLFTPLLVGLQLLFPAAPVLLGGYAAVVWSLLLYEILHAIDHWPYEWWKKATEHPRFGGLGRLLYGFHLMHHANISCNEAISGFFAIPVPDLCFGTYHQPKQLLLEGRRATADEFTIRPPFRWVRWLDRWSRKRETRMHHRGA